MRTSQHAEIQLQTSRPRMRLGLLLDDQLAPGWIHESIEQLLCAESVELVAIVFSGRPRASRLPPRSILFTLWRKFDKWVFSKNDDPLAPELKTYPVPTITLTPFDGMSESVLPDRDVERICACNLDVLVQLGSSDLPDRILSCAKYGVWFFDYGEYTEVQGEVALFWNLNAGRSTYELVLRAASGNPRRDRVLCRRIFPRHLVSLEYNLALDCRRRAQILLQCLSEFHRQGFASMVIEDVNPNTIVGGRIDCASLNRVTVSWFVRSLRCLFARICSRQQWILAYGRANSWAKAEQTEWGPLNIVLPPIGQNYADPFPFELGGKTCIFFERYADKGLGTICCAELYADGTLSTIQLALARNYHLSYPFVFEWNGDIYLLPETWDNRTVEVYGAVDFPRRWELAGVLLKNVTAVDPTILEHNGRLWLFAAGLGGPGTEWSELSLFFAHSLFGEWRRHPKNPIVRDLRRARPAGRLFFQHGILVRPGQDCSEGYGHSISFNSVDVLSETDYKETPLTTILPNWMPTLSATHTFNQQGRFVILDGQMRVPRGATLSRNLRAFLYGSRFRGVTGNHPARVRTPRKLAFVKTSFASRVSGCGPQS